MMTLVTTPVVGFKLDTAGSRDARGEPYIVGTSPKTTLDRPSGDLVNSRC